MAKKTVKAKGTTKKARRKVGDLIPVSITKAEEHWSIYKFSDGTTLRTRPIIIEIERQHGKFDDNGNPIYQITGGTVHKLTAPSKLRKEKK